MAFLIVGCVFAAYPELETLNAPKIRRHVLLLTVDTLRADYLSACGYDRPTTPFLDSLMAQGFRFTRAVTSIPRTTQALSTLMTGCYPHTTRVRHLVDRLPQGVVPVAQLARQKGYTTVGVVSNNILPGRRLGRGFNVYDASRNARNAADTTNAILSDLETHRSDEALFIWAHYFDPHVPYYPPPQLAMQFDPDYDGPYKLHFTLRDKRGFGDLSKVDAVYRNTLPDSVNAHIRRLYAADIRFTDNHIARLIKELRKRFGDDWLIVFTADHGESLGEHDYFYEHGDYVYNPELHVPLAVIFPHDDPLRAHGVVDARVSLVDVMPTLVELLGLPHPKHLGYEIEGRSLVPYFRGESLPPRPVFAESAKNYFPKMVRRRVRFDVSGRFRAVMFGNWKLIWTPGRIGDDQFELFNLADDPGETENVYTSNRITAAPLEAALRAWSKTADNPAAAPKEAALTEPDLDILRALGYAPGDSSARRPKPEKKG